MFIKIKESLIQLIISKYLLFSLRVNSYSANVFFSSIIDPISKYLIPNSLIRTFSYWIIGMIEYEITAKIIDKLYKPGFVLKGNNKNSGSKIVELDENSYYDRIRAEKIILQLIIYFGFNLILSVIINRLLNNAYFTTNILFGFLGGIMAFVNFMSIALFASALSPSGIKPASERPMVFIISLFCYFFVLIYIAFAIYYGLFSFC